MIPPAAAVETTGAGPDLVLVHGTGADAASWRPLMRRLRTRLRLTAYARRGSPGWPGADAGAPTRVDAHAADLADVIGALAAGPVHLLGASFGGTIALELARTRPELVSSCALFEPAVAGHDGVAAAPAALLAEFEKWLSRGRPERGAEIFQRRVLSEAVWRRLSPASRERACGMWRHIHGDLAASAAYRLRSAELGCVDLPFLLLRGGRSLPAFEAPLQALAAALPRTRLRVIAGAGHQSFGLAWRELDAALSEFIGV